MVVIAIVVFGWVSLDRLPVDLMPEVSYPTITVRGEYPGAAPEEVERDLVEAMEEVLRTVEGVVSVESVSRPSLGEVYLRFQWGTDLDVVSQRVRERLALAQIREGVPPPRILRYDPALEPMFRVALSGRSSEFLRAYAEDELAPTLEAVPGVALVQVRGGGEAVIRVEVDMSALARYALTVERVEERLRAENLSLVGGRLKDRGREVLLRTDNEFRALDELRALVLTTIDGVPLRLNDVASVARVVQSPTAYTTWRGEASVELDVFREADANLVAVSDRIRARLFDDEQSLAQRAPPQVELAVSSDQSTYIRAAISEVQSNAILGAICAILVLLLFLRSLFPTFVIGLAIPLSVMATFAPLYWAGVSLNIMSLGGLALGIGLLVDNAVVVLEAIVRRSEAGDSPREAALSGAGEVMGAVMVATFTTVAVFVPIVFLEGIASLFFRDLAMTVVFSLVASLFFAVFFVPMLFALRGREAAGPLESEQREADAQEAPRGLLTVRRWREDWEAFQRIRRASAGFTRGLLTLLTPVVIIGLSVRFLVFFPLELVFRVLGGALLSGLGRGAAILGRWSRRFREESSEGSWGGRALDAYRRLIRGALQARSFVLSSVGLLFVGAVIAWPYLGLELVPKMEEGEFYLRLEYPPGMSVEAVAAATVAVEREVLAIPRVAATASMAGEDSRVNQSESLALNVSRLRVQLETSDTPSETQDRVLVELRTRLRTIPGLRWGVESGGLLGASAPLRVEVYGEELDALRRGALQVEEHLAGMDGLVDIRNRQLRGSDELVVRLRRDRLAAYGLNAQTVAEEIASLTRGQRATTVRVDDERLDVELRAPEDASLRTLEGLQISLPATPFGAARSQADTPMVGGIALEEVLRSSAASSELQQRSVQLGTIADFELVAGPSEIRRVRGRRVAVVEAAADVRDVGGLIEELQASLHSLQFDDDLQVQLAGQGEDMEDARRGLILAFALALFLVYAVMASLFESFIGPLLIIVSVPLAIAAVVIGLAIVGFPISVLVLIGWIVLIGIIVNNAIVLVDAMMHLERMGVERHQAIVEASATRLRPVLITATTTILALVPMLFARGEGAEMRQPLAFVLVVGLSVSTVLTLVVVPVLYQAFMPKISTTRIKTLDISTPDETSRIG